MRPVLWYGVQVIERFKNRMSGNRSREGRERVQVSLAVGAGGALAGPATADAKIFGPVADGASSPVAGAATVAGRRDWLPWRGAQLGLSAKLVGFVLLFVMMAEVLVFLPSIAMFRQNWLGSRLAAAQLASLAADVTPESAVPESLKAELLRTAQIRMVALKRNDQRRLILQEDMDEPVRQTHDLREAQQAGGWRSPSVGFGLMRDALAVFLTNDKTHMRVIGQPNENAGEVIEVVMPIGPLKAAMVQHGLNVLGLSVVISFLTAVPIYLLLNSLFVRPITDLSRGMVRFREQPEDASRIIVPSSRADEIGTAERELAHMQSELVQMLGHKSHLAALGLAVSKINHDLRNLLANAQLLSDRLATVREPTVQRLAPKLVASIDRAIRFCNDTLQYGRAAEPQPRRERFDLRMLVVDVGEGLDLSARDAVKWIVDVPVGVDVDADRDQMYRVFTNLLRNSVQAFEAQSAIQPVLGDAGRDGQPVDTGEAGRGRIVVTGRRTDAGVVIDVRDNGPGLPARARTNLFRPFEGSTRRDGTGLGLSIVQEIILAHGGQVDYVSYSSGVRGAHFRIALPDRNINSAN